MVDWKSLLLTDTIKEKMQQVTIDGFDNIRDAFNDCGGDILFYLSKGYRNKIVMQIVQESNKHFEFLTNEEKERFKGKVSYVAHSLGSVITFDLLMRQQKETKFEE